MLSVPRRIRFALLSIAGLLLAALGQVDLSRSEQAAHPPGLAALALAVGAGLFAIGCSQRPLAERQNQMAALHVPPGTAFHGRAAAVVGTVGLVRWVSRYTG